jgi:glutamate/tyrosine decarboxylase-like PLP-dependent enzyme
MRELLRAAADRAATYLEGLEDRPVAPNADAVARLATLNAPLPNDPASAEAVLRELDEIGSPATMGMAGPRFYGFVIGGSLPAALAANWLAGAWDQGTSLFNITPATAVFEEVALAWMLDLFGLPPGSAGAFVTGTTVAHISALAAARHAVLERAGWNVEADGLFGAPPITVIVGGEAHPTLSKALGVIGLGRKRVVNVPVDDQGRMRVDQMPKLSGPTIICAQAGNVNTGSFDPLRAICERGREANAWVHVDGAFGLWARVAPSRAHLADGIELADSWATDGHKWLNVPYDSGFAFCVHPDAHRAAIGVTASYLVQADGGERDEMDWTPEFSRRARGFAVYAALRSLGRSGVADLIERSCAHARRFAELLEAGGASILNDVVLNQVLVRFGDGERTREVIRSVQEDGTCWLSGTDWGGEHALRISVSNWRTTEEDVERSAAALLAAARLHSTV